MCLCLHFYKKLKLRFEVALDKTKLINVSVFVYCNIHGQIVKEKQVIIHTNSLHLEFGSESVHTKLNKYYKY